MSLFKFTHHKLFVAMAATGLVAMPLMLGLGSSSNAAAGPQPSGWMSGDFHQHTLYTDGSTPFDFVMQKSDEFGLDWWANSEHGGGRNRDGEGQL